MKARRLPNLQRNARFTRLATPSALRIMQMSTVAGLASLLCACAGQPNLAGVDLSAPAEAPATAAADKVVVVPLERTAMAATPKVADEELAAKARALICRGCETPAPPPADFNALALRATPQLTMRQEAIAPVAASDPRLSPEEVMGRLKSLSAEMKQGKAGRPSFGGTLDAGVDDNVETATIRRDQIMTRLTELSSLAKTSRARLPEVASLAAPGNAVSGATVQAHAPALPAMAAPLNSVRVNGGSDHQAAK